MTIMLGHFTGQAVFGLTPVGIVKRFEKGLHDC